MARICEVCGKEFDKPAWLPPFENICDESSCFHTKRWQMKLDELEKNPKAFAIIEGNCYFVGNNNDPGTHGFGGRKFQIKYSDGEVTTTTNLWDNGRIPDAFRDKMPDNAVFVELGNYDNVTYHY